MCHIDHIAKRIRCVAALVLVCAGIAPSFAQTPVAGPIGQNAAWTVAGSPYVLSGDVTIENGASVSIEPGVRVLMNAGANLRVVAGALSAQGTREAPIVVTSAKDVAGSGATVQPGDWGRLVFEDGTNDANTVLAHVRIRYGAGVAINAASPRIDDTDISDSAGAAIAIDLASSPVGRGLSASGNAVNGIVVPAGVVVGDVAWRLKGIPYVVEQGALEIGLPPFSLSPDVLQLVAGGSGELRIDLPEPAPAGGISVALSTGANGVASVASPVVVPAGAHTATAAVTANHVGETTVTATAGAATAQARVVVAALPSLTLAPDAGSVGVGRPKTVTLSRNATAGAIVVDLAPSNPGVLSVPANVALAAGQASATFEVTGLAPGATWLRASAAGYSMHERVIEVHALQLIPSQNNTVLALGTGTVTFQLSDPAPAGGLVVTIYNPAAEVLETPASVTVPAGASAGALALRSLKNASSMVAQIGLSAPGYEPAMFAVSIHRLEPILGVSSLPLGTTWSAPLRLSAPAPAGGVTIALSSLVPGIVDIVPAEVTIAAGQSESSVPIAVRSVRAGRSVIRLRGVNYESLTTLENVEVTTPARLEIGTWPMRIGQGLVGHRLPDIVDAYGQRANPGFSVFYRIESSDPVHVGADAETHTWYHDTSSSTFFVQGLETTTAPVPVRVRNTQPANGIGDSPAFAVDVVPSQPTFRNIGDETAAVGERKAFSVEWGDLGELPPAGARLSVVDANPPGLVALYGASDATAPSATLHGQTVWFEASAAGTFRVKVELDGAGAWTTPVQTVAPPALVFADSELSLGLGLTTGYIGVFTQAGDSDASLQLPTDFAVVSSDPAKVDVVAVYRQWSGASVVVRALAATAPSQPVVVRATAGGRVAGEMAVTVVPAAIAFVDLDGVRSTASVKDAFTVRWAGEHDPHSDQATTVNVALAGGATPGVLPEPAIVRPGGGAAALTIDAGANAASGQLEVATPTALGTYRLAASTPPGVTGLSAVQSVGPGVLRLGPTSFRTRYIFPIAKTITAKARVALLDGPDGGEIAATTATTVHLVSRAPAWVSVPASVVIAAGQSSAEFDVTGVEVTGDGETVAVDAYVDGVAEPAASLPVGVFPLDVVLRADGARTPNDPPAPLSATLQFSYPCQDEVLAAMLGKETASYSGNYCTESVAFAQARAAAVQIVSDGAPPVVPGFLVAPGGAATSTLNFPADSSESDTIYVDTPARAGSYRVRLTLDGTTYDSDRVDVAALRIVAATTALTVGAGTRDEDGLDLSLLVGDAIANGPPAPIAIQVACAAASVCSTPASVEMVGNLVTVPVTGVGAGTTTLTLSAPGLPPIAPVTVTVVEPTLEIRTHPDDPALDIGAAAQVWVELAVPGSYSPKAVQPFVVELANVDAAVASAPATLTIAAGQSRSADGELRALGAGRTALLGTAPGAADASSKVVVVNEAGE